MIEVKSCSYLFVCVHVCMCVCVCVCVCMSEGVALIDAIVIAAFDSVEYNVLLHHLYSFGIRGKAWRIICSCYTNLTCAVHLNNQTSNHFTVQLSRIKYSQDRNCSFFMSCTTRGIDRSSRPENSDEEGS